MDDPDAAVAARRRELQRLLYARRASEAPLSAQHEAELIAELEALTPTVQQSLTETPTTRPVEREVDALTGTTTEAEPAPGPAPEPATSTTRRSRRLTAIIVTTLVALVAVVGVTRSLLEPRPGVPTRTGLAQPSAFAGDISAVLRQLDRGAADSDSGFPQGLDDGVVESSARLLVYLDGSSARVFGARGTDGGICLMIAEDETAAATCAADGRFPTAGLMLSTDIHVTESQTSTRQPRAATVTWYPDGQIDVEVIPRASR